MALNDYPKKKICMVIGYGQSNEGGTASVPGSGADCHFGGMYGFPLYTLSGRGSMFTLLADQLGKEGHAVMINNQSIGGSGCLSAWSGYARSWLPNSYTFLPGAWVLPTIPNGRKYKAAGTFGVNQPSGATEPTWGTTIGGTTSDNLITWTAYATDANDVVGTVYLPGMSGYDPLGYCQAVVDAITKAKSQGFEVWSFMQGHQSDDTYPVAPVITSLTSMVGRALSAGADRVYLGIANRQMGAGNEALWDDGGFFKTLRSSVLSAYSSNPKVMAGADLSVMQDLAVTMDAGIHLNVIGVQRAADIWRAAL